VTVLSDLFKRIFLQTLLCHLLKLWPSVQRTATVNCTLSWAVCWVKQHQKRQFSGRVTCFLVFMLFVYSHCFVLLN